MLHHSQENNRFGAVFERVKQSGTNPVTLFGNIPNFHAMSYAISTRLFHFGDVSLRFGSIFHIQTYRIKISIPLDKNVHVMFFMRLTRPWACLPFEADNFSVISAKRCQKEERYFNFKLKISLNLYHIFFKNQLLLWNILILKGNFKKSTDFSILVNNQIVGEITIFFIYTKTLCRSKDMLTIKFCFSMMYLNTTN